MDARIVEMFDFLLLLRSFLFIIILKWCWRPLWYGRWVGEGKSQQEQVDESGLTMEVGFLDSLIILDILPSTLIHFLEFFKV